jgi:allantoinase
MAAQSNPRAVFKMSSEHAKLTPPSGRPLIIHVVVNIEYWAYDQPTPRTIVVPPHGRSQVPDLPNFCWSEYGNRCGMPRLLKLFGDRHIPVSASINASVPMSIPRSPARCARPAGSSSVTAFTSEHSVLKATSARSSPRR